MPPRLSRNQNRTSPTSSESNHLTTHPLSPPRPFFFQDSRRDSASDSSLSDSDREQPAPPPRVQQQPRRTSASYAPVATTTPISASFSRRRASNPFDTPYQQDTDAYAPVAGAGAEDHELSPTWNAANLYYNDAPEPSSPGRPRATSRTGPPPSSFQFPFQSHAGNPDPLPPRRRSGSFESLTSDQNHWSQQAQHPRAFSDASHDGLPQPAAPFMNAPHDRHSASSTSLSGMVSGNSVYRGSAAAAMLSPSQTALNAAYQAGQASVHASVQDLGGAPAPPFAGGSAGSSPFNTLPRTSSHTSFRAPFLSPASRPGSSLWSPPSYSTGPNGLGGSPEGGSTSAFALPAPPAPAPSTRLAGKLTKEEKPWLQRSAPRARASWWLTFACMLLGVAGAAALCYFGITSVDMFKDSELCSVLEDDFNEFDLTNTWTREVQLGGFGNAEFQIASSFDNNSYTQNGELYIMPTLTSAWLGESRVQSGTAATNKTACTATGNGGGTIINPVMSARISTKDHFSMTYGRVEVRAKLPRGDWLWPAIWMLPVNGTWPQAGEIDIMEARGNSPSYQAQGSNFVRATMQYGPLASVVARLYGWYGLKRTSFDKGFHTYGLEWDDKWMRFYVDSRVHTALDISLKNSKSSFWNRAAFPATAQNGSSEVPLENTYQNINSPFDKPFYLIIDLAVGGTSGWFPDKIGNKPWFDGSLSAMSDFYKAKDSWYSTWPQNPADGAFRMCVSSASSTCVG
ncbi:concanavalin A-like lectin/glucanase domain-containing protein [Mycena filopes]|nr:concanavalin A-like lectin/glucanase domain-containing protein [Mycena filopes]